ncbi:reverse transcriptase domain-containing protein [Tanacetum coccineum]|uniref:Reverse transcriptase domain-containing protein n=1 Tax=Tanacetum coccineum TaxID=301880 RepID=A0ABQ5GWA2_9ASTR
MHQEEDGQFDVIGHVVACKDLDNYDKNEKAGKKNHSLWWMLSTLFKNQDIEKSENTASRILTASENYTKESFVSKIPPKNIAELLDVAQKKSDGKDDWFCTKCNVVPNIKTMFRLQIRVQDESGTMSLTLWNDEVQPIVDRSAYQLCEKYEKVFTEWTLAINLIGAHRLPLLFKTMKTRERSASIVMSTSTHPIIILPDFDVEDAFSSIDYTSASPDYSSATQGNTSSNSETESDPSDDPSEDRSAPLAITPFLDDLYMHIRREYYVTSEESSDSSSSSTIPPPPAPVYPHSDPEEIMPPHKRDRFLSPPSSSSDLSTSPRRHKEQIDALLNHLDEFPLERIEQIEYGIEGLRERMRHDDEVVLTRVRISTMEVLIEDILVRYRSDTKSLLDTIHELKNHKGGPPDY